MRRHEWRRVSLLAFGVFLLALVPRLLGLDVFLTADEPKAWFGRAIQFLDALARADWAATFDTPAPGVTTMWAGAIGLLLEYVRQGLPGGSLTTFLASVPFDPLDPNILPLIRLPIVLMAAAAAPLTYVWGRPLWGHKAAILAALFLAFDPFLLALSRVLGHDALVAVFMWLSLLAFLRATNQFLISNPQPPTSNLQSPNTFDRRYIVVSGALGGLAFLTKYPSLFLGMFIAVTMLLLHASRRQPWQHRLRAWIADVALWSLAAGLVFVVLWPAMWVDPVGRVTSIVNDALRASGSPHPKGSFYLGQPVPDPGSGFYALVTLFRTTPLLWLGWLLAGVTYIAWRPRWAHGRSALVLLAFALLYGLLVTVGGKKQDRYILPAFPALAVLAALGYAQISNIKSQISNHKLQIAERPDLHDAAGVGESPVSNLQSPISLSNGLLAAAIVLQAALALPHYPYYFTYYNPLMGGGPAAARMLNVGWGEGLDQAARWLNSLPGAENSSVVAWYSTTFEPFFRGNAIYKIDEEKISRSSKPGLAADYVVLYINQVQRELPSAGALQFFRSATPVYTVTLHGIDYAWIYPSVKMQHVIAGEARLVGQAELLGYDLTDEAGQPVTAVSPASVPRLSLYWEWQGNAEGEPIRASLVDDSGKTRGWGNWLQTVAPLPRSEWQEGMVVRDDFGLAIFEDTPPGEYRLAVWIDRPAKHETVGVFPLEGEVKIPVAPREAK
jgi:4-amino-4-deoxy-L-arabinose transferase-like glycosyltransferase